MRLGLPGLAWPDCVDPNGEWAGLVAAWRELAEDVRRMEMERMERYVNASPNARRRMDVLERILWGPPDGAPR